MDEQIKGLIKRYHDELKELEECNLYEDCCETTSRYARMNSLEDFIQDLQNILSIN